ncbi:MarR family transcriptional regulator, partial [Xanthomonas citri pv. citri]|nr:MarR family transcriptional regulator [Xanthomonas citri pv. citri]
MSEIPHDDTAVQHPSGLPLAHWLTLTEGLIAARVAESLEEHGL